ncbi:MAG: PAS domain-containing protein [Campylobacterota bacterium]|nr:PAS domain-containing protein [Campylobacterota bacterium]
MSHPTPIDEEFEFTGRVIISETDLNGVITFANRKFCEISGYSPDELVGKPHNIIRHPDMPRAAFATMWETIQSGATWNGLVKNLRKDGLYYWVETEISPVCNDLHETVGYIAARKPVSRSNVEEATRVYKKLLESER